MELDTAVRILCNASHHELSQLSDITSLRSKLMTIRKGAVDTTLPGRLSIRLDELRTFCKDRNAESMVGKRSNHDYRIVDIQLVDAKSRPKTLQAEIRRVMAERSLACDFNSHYPNRLASIRNKEEIRGKRNSDTIRSFASKYFAKDVREIVRRATQSGVKLLALEQEYQSYAKEPFCLIGLFAIAYTQFKTMGFADIKTHLASRVLLEAIEVARDSSSLMFAAFEVYRKQCLKAKTSKQYSQYSHRLKDADSRDHAMDRTGCQTHTNGEHVTLQTQETTVPGPVGSTHHVVSNFTPQQQDIVSQRQHENETREQNTAALFCKSTIESGTSMLTPSFMPGVDRQVAQPPGFNAFGDGTPSVDQYVADFSQFGEASTPLPQVANFSDFGGSYTQVIQPANFSDFGEASTAIVQPQLWQMDQAWNSLGQPCNFPNSSTLV